MKEQRFIHSSFQRWRPGAPSQVGAYFASMLFFGGIACLLKLPPVSPWFIPVGLLCLMGGIVLAWRNRRCLWGDRREDLRKLYSRPN